MVDRNICTLCQTEIAPPQLYQDERRRVFHFNCFDAALREILKHDPNACKIVGTCTSESCSGRFNANRLPPPDRHVACPKCGDVVRFSVVQKNAPPPPPIDEPLVDPASMSDLLDEAFASDAYAGDREELRRLLKSTGGGKTLNPAGGLRARQLIVACLAARPDRCPNCQAKLREVQPVGCYECDLHFEQVQQRNLHHEAARQEMAEAIQRAKERAALTAPSQHSINHGDHGFVQELVAEVGVEILFQALLG